MNRLPYLALGLLLGLPMSIFALPQSKQLVSLSPEIDYKQASDPTLPISPDSPLIIVPDNTLNLEAIFYHGENSQIIINGNTLGLHDKIANFQVVGITRENVQLKGENGIVSLSLHPQCIKKN